MISFYIPPYFDTLCMFLYSVLLIVLNSVTDIGTKVFKETKTIRMTLFSYL